MKLVNRICLCGVQFQTDWGEEGEIGLCLEHAKKIKEVWQEQQELTPIHNRPKKDLLWMGDTPRKKETRNG